MFADHKKTLTIFHDIIDTIAKQLLLLENISITFNNKNVFIKMEVTS